MGVEPYALAGALGMVLAQRLARRLCTACSRAAQESEGAGVPEHARCGAKVAVGCDACHGTGYRGRVLIVEKLSASEALHDAIMSKAPRNRFLEIAAGEQEDLETAAWDLVARGVTTSYEVRRVLAGGAA
jgi:type II secretory ATPase GspE/PulE/Tfp pilus assembly ATPase PilB-like protein